MIENDWIAYGSGDLCRNLITDSWTGLEWCPKAPSGRQILDASGQDNIFLDQDSNYFMLSISVFLFVEPHTVNSTETWPVTMLRGLEINIWVLQQCWVSKWLSKGLSRLSFPLPLFFLFWRLTSLFIKTDPATLDQMKNSSLNYKFDCTQDLSAITSPPPNRQ